MCRGKKDNIINHTRVKKAVASPSMVSQSDAEAHLNWEVIITKLALTSYTIDKLLPGTPYKFRVRGSSQSSTSEDSSSTNGL
jgi:hypothetical protein